MYILFASVWWHCLLTSVRPPTSFSHYVARIFAYSSCQGFLAETHFCFLVHATHFLWVSGQGFAVLKSFCYIFGGMLKIVALLPFSSKTPPQHGAATSMLHILGWCDKNLTFFPPYTYCCCKIIYLFLPEWCSVLCSVFSQDCFFIFA